MAQETGKSMAVWAAEFRENKFWVLMEAELRAKLNGVRNETDRLEYGTEDHRAGSYEAKYLFEFLDLIEMKSGTLMKGTK